MLKKVNGHNDLTGCLCLPIRNNRGNPDSVHGMDPLFTPFAGSTFVALNESHEFVDHTFRKYITIFPEPNPSSTSGLFLWQSATEDRSSQARMASPGASLLVSGFLKPKSLTSLVGGLQSWSFRACSSSGGSQRNIKQGKLPVGRLLHEYRHVPLRVSCMAVSRNGTLSHSTMVDKTETAQATLVEHVVLFKVKSDAPEEKVEEIYNALGGLKKLECVLDLSAGKALQILGGDFTHVLHSRYRNKEDLNTYQQHPEHVGIVKNLLPLVDNILALDWEAEPAGSPVDGGHRAARIALIKLADAISETQSTEVFDLLYGLKEKFPFIRQVSAGLNFSPDRSQGLNVGFLALFNNVEELEQLNGNRELHSILQKSRVAPFLDKRLQNKKQLPPFKYENCRNCQASRPTSQRILQKDRLFRYIERSSATLEKTSPKLKI
ncbi:hypothetical protein R1flu_006221 [Riccia fluitans]|uniref:Stress-response A/B barrel domain-containing protein n=1 Tax=Riccia fluitans TaxID=41844 RepID=A0ABD1YVE1_9MARC